MKKFFKNYSTTIIFVTVLVLDYKFDLLGNYLGNDRLEKLIMILGAIGYSVTTKPNLKASIFADDVDNEIGGGGIKNPKNGG